MNAIETRNLTRRFGSLIAVGGLNLTIAEGECFALLGVNGAGKTTAIRMLCGLLPPTGGEAYLMGRNIATESAAAKSLLNISPQETAVAPNLTVKENLEFIAGIYGMSSAAARRAAEDMLTRLSLEEVAGRRAGKLSGGWQRRLSIAMALITDPEILFLDEPTLGLGVLARRGLWQVIEGLKGRTTLVLTTHYLEEARYLADRIGIMSKGKLKAAGSAQELMETAGTEDFEEAFVRLAAGEEGAV